MTPRGDSQKPTPRRLFGGEKAHLEQVRGGVDLCRALHASCTWWLEEERKCALWNEIQYKNWRSFCEAVVHIDLENSFDAEKKIHAAFERYLMVTVPEEEAFFTGYYEPLLKGSRTFLPEYSTPLYLLPEEKKFTRAEIKQGALFGKNLELAYVNCPVDAFFLEIQGSGRIDLEGGTTMCVGYVGQNGFPYTAIGACVKEVEGWDAIDFHRLKGYLKADISRAHTFMDKNESYVFFKENKGEGGGPTGTQGLPLTPLHSVACDPRHYPFGLPMMIEIPEMNVHTMVLTQDTGGAIKGPLRFDYFTGYGSSAEHLAGSLKHVGKVSVWWPKAQCN